MSGKVIRPDDDGMTIKSDKISMWKDRKTVQEYYKFGTFTSIHNVWKPLSKKTVMDQGSPSIAKEFKTATKHRRNLPKRRFSLSH